MPRILIGLLIFGNMRGFFGSHDISMILSDFFKKNFRLTDYRCLISCQNGPTLKILTIYLDILNPDRIIVVVMAIRLMFVRIEMKLRYHFVCLILDLRIGALE